MSPYCSKTVLAIDRRCIVTGLVGVATGLTAARLGFGDVLAQAASPSGRVHALLVGINTYAGKVRRRGLHGRPGKIVPIGSLRGCLNDVAAIEAAVRPIAVTVEVLREHQATRPAVMAAWQRLVAVAMAGDTILFTFSGHGGLEFDRIARDKPTGHNPALLLHGYDHSQPRDRADRIVSYEIRQLVAGAEKKRVRVVFVADCCHAGTLTRSVAPEVADSIRYRTAGEYEGLDEGPLVVAPASPREASNLVYFSASQDHQLTPEVLIAGSLHGAMSVAFARALSGLASLRADGAVTGAALEAYVTGQLRSLSDQLQDAKISWPTTDVRSGIAPETVLFYTRPPAVATTAGEVMPPVRLRILGHDASRAKVIVDGLSGATLVGTGEPADVSWDAGAGRCTNGRDPIADGIEVGALQAVVDRQRAHARLKGTVAAVDNLVVRLLADGERVNDPPRDGGRTLNEGTKRTLVVLGRKHEHLVVLNLAGNGGVQMLYPRPNGGEPMRVSVNDGAYRMRVDVRAPFGSDLVVALASQHSTTGLVAALHRLDGTPSALRALDALLSHHGAGQSQLGFLSIFTARKE